MAEQKELKYVRFDVGHHLHVCHRDTLLKNPESVLAKFVSPEFDNRKSEQEYIIIDRDGKHFGAILNYLRDGAIDLSSYKPEDLEQLRKEAEYYCLQELVELCQSEPSRRKMSLKELPLVSLEPPPPNIFYELDYAITTIRSRHDCAIIARARVLDKACRRDIYNLFYPIPVYFCLPSYTKNPNNNNYNQSRTSFPTFSLYNSEGVLKIESQNYSSSGDSYEINDFLAKVKGTYINPSIKI